MRTATELATARAATDGDDLLERSSRWIRNAIAVEFAANAQLGDAPEADISRRAPARTCGRLVRSAKSSAAISSRSAT